ncbi:MAG: P1 family peptidase [Anaerolineae bacterium]|nr:P1 family peptidase [Anaerolineae bacterium]
MARARLRDLGIEIGVLPTGEHNAITDVPGVTVGHVTLNYDEPRVARTGVTVVCPRGDRSQTDFPFAGYHSLNGCGEMTGIAWVEESGLLMSPVALTNTHQVGVVRDAITLYASQRIGGGAFWLPVVGEIYDGWLNDINAHHITCDHVFQALDSATGGPVPEGNVGGGTGSICHGFKGGIGTASRVATTDSGKFTVGALVQTNQGDRLYLLVDGVPVGREIGYDLVPPARDRPSTASSIIVILATDAPLLPQQCRALAQRATIGLSRTGSRGHIYSGDLFLAFATGNHYPRDTRAPALVRMMPLAQLNPLFDAAVEAVEEAILNSLTAAQTMTGQLGRTAHALPLDRLQQVMARYGRGPHS